MSIKINVKLECCAAGGDGSLYYQVTCGRQVCKISTSLQLRPSEWDALTQTIVYPSSGDEERERHLIDVDWRIKYDVDRLKGVVATLCQRGGGFSADAIASEYLHQTEERSLKRVIGNIVRQKKAMGGGAVRTAETYENALNSFMRFTGDHDVPIDGFHPALLQRYEKWLLKSVCRNTVGFYMKRLRAAFNAAVALGLAEQTHPFKGVFTGREKTRKLACSPEDIKKVVEADLSGKPGLSFARDMFIFSLGTQGMSFADMGYLKKEDIKDGRIEYRRRKSGSQVSVKYRAPIEQIAHRWDPGTGDYLLPIITRPGDPLDERRQVRRVQTRLIRDLKRLSEELDIPALSMNAARHTWGTWIRNISSLSVASAGLAHSSEETTLIYIGDFDYRLVDDANEKILTILFGKDSL